MAKVIVANYFNSDFPKVIASLDDSVDEIDWVNGWLAVNWEHPPQVIDVTQIDKDQFAAMGYYRYLVLKRSGSIDDLYITRD
mgnify:CR=1 FL=1